jgi:uncharacterized protein (DUF433 family)
MSENLLGSNIISVANKRLIGKPIIKGKNAIVKPVIKVKNIPREAL